MKTESTDSGVEVTLSTGDAKIPARLGQPDHTSIFFLDPPSGLGRQTPAVSRIRIQLPQDALDLFVGDPASAAEIVLIDRNGEAICEAIEAQPQDDAEFGNGYVVMRSSHFRDWARREGRLVALANYAHTWERHPT